MKLFPEKFKNIFKRGSFETESMEKAGKERFSNINGASDIARSIRSTEKFQARAKSWRSIFFFLIAVALILFALSYVY